jgi:hypothetical protein
MTGKLNQAIVFLTHLNRRRIRRHFSRLKREAKLDAFFFLHQGNVTEGQRILPNREAERNGRPFNNGFNDLVCFPIFQKLDRYSHIWLVEYDVDYAGHWGEFFAIKRFGDFVGTTIVPQSESNEWYHWRSFVAPHDARPTRSFAPIFRLSRRMIDCYVQSIATGKWKGHFEALFPTIALYNGLTIEDVGGYTNTPNDPYLSPGTFVYRPARTSYFHEWPDSFERGFLYHPVKPKRPLSKRLILRLTTLIARA